MRVLLDEGEVYAWLPAGHFTIHADDSVTWHTEFGPLTEHAGASDDEAVTIPQLDERVTRLREGRGRLCDVYHVAHLDRLAAVFEEDDGRARLVVTHPGSAEVEHESVLDWDPPRLPGFDANEWWSEDAELLAAYARGTRLGPYGAGFSLTSNETGHVGFFSCETWQFDASFRVPAAPENTVYACDTPQGYLVGVKFNYRHSEIRHVALDHTLLGTWPSSDDPDAVRWGMPAPVIIGDYVVTYSDEGPHRKSLHLLRLPDLQEVDFLPLDHWPTDACGDGMHFAFLSKNELVLGTVADAKIEITRTWPLREVMKLAGVGDFPRPDHATTDGRGSRLWLDRQLDFLGVDRSGPVVVSHEDGEVCQVEESDTYRTILAAQPPSEDPLAALLFANRRQVWDVARGQLLISSGTTLSVIDVETTDEVRRIDAGERIVAARFGATGEFFVTERDDVQTRRWSKGEESRVLSSSPRRFGQTAEAGLVIDGPAAWWFEYDFEQEVLSDETTPQGVHIQRTRTVSESYSLCHWLEGEARVERVMLQRPIENFAVCDGTAYVVTTGRRGDPEGYGTRLLQHVAADGTLTPVSPEPVPRPHELVVSGNRAYLVKALGHSNAGIEPSELFSVCLETGRLEHLARGCVGGFSHLTLHFGELWWLESADATMRFLDLGTRQRLAAICRLDLA